MTKIYFRYNPYYDLILAKLGGEDFDWGKYEISGSKFQARLENHWQEFNDKIFTYYKSLGLVLPDFWFAYIVHSHKNLIPFSDPLTIIIKDDLDEVTATLVHEICHVFFGYYENAAVCNKLYAHIDKEFANEDRDTKFHLTINPLAAAGLNQIYSKEKAMQLLSLEKEYTGLKRAWEIIDSAKLTFSDPVKEILNLKTK